MIADRRAGITFACYVFAVLLGLLIAYLDIVSLFGDDSAKVTLLLLIVSSGLLGLIQPRRPWRWAVAIGLCLPAVHFLRHVLGLAESDPPLYLFPASGGDTEGGYTGILILVAVSLAACLVGSFCGSWLRKALFST
jgi:hypothetical protein